MLHNYMFSNSNNDILVVILVRISYLIYDCYIIDLCSIFTPIHI